MLRDFLTPILQSLPDGSNIWFQQDGAPPHYSKLARDCVQEMFGDQWIGRGGPVEWPPRSPDLNPLDFFFWSHLKRTVYNNNPRNLIQLKENIIRECRTITEETLLNVESSCWRRMLLCKQNYGAHIEHLLR